MKVGLYEFGGNVRVADSPEPPLPKGGLLVQTEACGICSGELMQWYMDLKAPHIFGHEVSGKVIASDNEDFPVGCRVAPHHHAPCLECSLCKRGAFVHCPQWKATSLNPGGMSEVFAVSAENLNDCHRVDDLAPEDAALAEPIACVCKSIRRGQVREGQMSAVIGAGPLGLAHAKILGQSVVFETNPHRAEHARTLGLTVAPASTDQKFERIFVCPGVVEAFDFAVSIAAPDAVIVLFAPLPDGERLPLSMSSAGYFKDLTIVHSYSCGPSDMEEALEVLRRKIVTAKDIVSDFVDLNDLPEAYQAMKDARILKAMVKFG